MPGLSASIIVRAKNESATLPRTIRAIRDQTVPAELIVVDSGSTDGTREIAASGADRVLDIPPDDFTYGYALNLGAAAAAGDIHFALSAHCFPDRRDWIELSLSLYGRPEIAATCGAERGPDGSRLDRTFEQTLEVARANPEWGFSNHASSWRASVWEAVAFDEHLAYGEDKEWALRVLATGRSIAVDPRLVVDMSHQWRTGTREFYSRERRSAEALASFAPPSPYGPRELARDWWYDLPADGHTRFAHRFLNYRRLAGLAGKYRGRRAARTSRDKQTPSPTDSKG